MVLKSKGALKSHATEPEVSASASRTKKAASNLEKDAPSKSGVSTRNKSPARTKSRSPARTKSPPRTKSPARPKSPSRRSPARTKPEPTSPPASSTPKIVNVQARSPVRRSPARKSPTRVTKTVSTSVKSISIEKRQIQPTRNKSWDLDDDFSDDPGQVHVQEKPQAAVRGRRKLEVQIEKLDLKGIDNYEEPSLNAVKRFTRSSQNREIERVVHLKHFDTVAKKMGEFSDEDDPVLLKKSDSIERSANFKQITEFGGKFGAAFFILFTPLSIIALHILCNERHCSFTRIGNFSFNKYLAPSTYFHLTSFLGFVSYATVLAILSAIPFGGKKVYGMPTKQGKFLYYMNGAFSFVILLTIAAVLEVWGIHIADFVKTHLFHLLISSVVFGFFMSFYAYIRSFYVPLSHLNAHVVNRDAIYGYFMGRELNPRAFGLLDMKMYVFRLGVAGAMLLDFALLFTTLNITLDNIKNLSFANLHIEPTLILLVLMHTIYFADGLLTEAAWVTSFEIQYEAFGFMSAVGYPIYPFMIASVTKYVVDYHVQLPLWQLIATFTLFIIGYLLFRGSNNQKDAFRKNPYDPALSHLETIPTTKGKKLLCSGFWGIVRHPNYLGDIMMNIAFAPFVLCVPPVITIWSIVVLLIHRSVRDNGRCKEKYGPAWDRYCSKVKYVLVPKVY